MVFTRLLSHPSAFSLNATSVRPFLISQSLPLPPPLSSTFRNYCIHLLWGSLRNPIPNTYTRKLLESGHLLSFQPCTPPGREQMLPKPRLTDSSLDHRGLLGGSHLLQGGMASLIACSPSRQREESGTSNLPSSVFPSHAPLLAAPDRKSVV